ncbi:hypothetical protein ACFZBU_40635 [Embleya sp. NPDC008237]|uniref:hypothetical protein n=1 Tax=Embleya sp. NPDC008237 TaxID=3363978 RepID=UPI0036EE7296
MLEISKMSGERLTLWALAEPGSVGGRCLYEGPIEASEGSILVFDTGPAAVERLRVVTAGNWSLRLRDPASAPEFDESIQGLGPQVVRYVGPGGVATVDASAREGGCTVLLYPAGPDERAEQWSESNAASQRIPLAGTQFVVVETADRWSITLESSAPGPHLIPIPTNGETFVQRGSGTRVLSLMRPSGDEPVIFEVALTSGPGIRVGVPHFTSRTDEDGNETWVDDRSREPRRLHPDCPRTQFMFPEDWGERVVIDISAPDSRWEVRLLRASELRALRESVLLSGCGMEVLRYHGPVAALRADRHWRGERWLHRYGRLWRSLESNPALGSGAPTRETIVGTSGSMELITVPCEDPWEVSAVPIESVRTFDHRISGCDSELLRHVGGNRVVVLRARRGYRGDVDVYTFNGRGGWAWVHGRFFIGLWWRSIEVSEEYVLVTSEKRRPWKIRTRARRWYD